MESGPGFDHRDRPSGITTGRNCRRIQLIDPRTSVTGTRKSSIVGRRTVRCHAIPRHRLRRSTAACDLLIDVLTYRYITTGNTGTGTSTRTSDELEIWNFLKNSERCWCLLDQLSDLPSAWLVFKHGSGHICLALHTLVVCGVQLLVHGPEGRVCQVHPQSPQDRKISSLEQQPGAGLLNRA